MVFTGASVVRRGKTLGARHHITMKPKCRNGAIFHVSPPNAFARLSNRPSFLLSALEDIFQTDHSSFFAVVVAMRHFVVGEVKTNTFVAGVQHT